MHVQRQTRKKGKLSERKINLLDNIGFVWDGIEDQWNKNMRNTRNVLSQIVGFRKLSPHGATSKEETGSTVNCQTNGQALIKLILNGILLMLSGMKTTTH